MMSVRAVAIASLVLVLLSGERPDAQLSWIDDGDRAAARAWFTLLADSQFYRTTDDVMDCAGLVRHALRETVRPHTPEWFRLAALPLVPSLPAIREPISPGPGGWRLFRVSDSDRSRYGEFADASTIIRLNARLRSRNVASARPGDLLYYLQPDQREPHHLMILVGRSAFEADGDDWVVYHTGPAPSTDLPRGEVRKTRLRELMNHPSQRWRPIASNPQFVGVFSLAGL